MSRSEPVTEDEVETIVIMKRDEGYSVREINERVGRSCNTIRRILEKNGIILKEQKEKRLLLSREDYYRVQEMKSFDLTSAQVSKEIGKPLAEVNRAYGSASFEYYIKHKR